MKYKKDNKYQTEMRTESENQIQTQAVLISISVFKFLQRGPRLFSLLLLARLIREDLTNSHKRPSSAYTCRAPTDCNPS